MAGHSAEFRVRADEPAVDGHFPGNPIVPGAVLLREVLRILAPQGDATCTEIRSARFFHPVRPGDRLVLRWQAQADGSIAFDCCSDGSATEAPERRALSGALRMQAA